MKSCIGKANLTFAVAEEGENDIGPGFWWPEFVTSNGKTKRI